MIVMRIKTGIDLLPIHKIQNKLSDEDFLVGTFHEFERHDIDVSRLSAIYALKECVFKALDISNRDWLAIEIAFSGKGKPRITLSNVVVPEDLASIDCSVSYENGYVLANVVFLLN